MSSGDIEQTEAQALVERVANSEMFTRAHQLRRLLLHVCEHALNKPGQELSEYDIATKVFGRRPEFNPKDDNIVRVQASNLRHRLEEYFQKQGSEERLVILLPRGSYVPRIDRRAARQSPHAGWRMGGRWAWLLTAAVGAAAVAVVALWRFDSYRPAAAVKKSDPLWSRLFTPGQKTNVLLADTSRVALLQMTGFDVKLDDYLRADYPGFLAGSIRPELRSFLDPIGTWQFTSAADAVTGSRLVEIGLAHGVRPVLRYPRHVNIREFKTDNFIVLGSRLSVPWVELFSPRLKYEVAWDEKKRTAALRSRIGLNGGRVEYWPESAKGLSYASIAIVSNLGDSGTALLLNGLDRAAAEAAGEFALDGRLSALVRQHPGDPQMELLLRVRVIDGAAARAEVIEYRAVKGDLAAEPSAGRQAPTSLH